MAITSLSFFIFVAITVTLDNLISVKKRWIVFLLASAVFYISFSPVGIFILSGTAFAAYYAARKIEACNIELNQWISENTGELEREKLKEKKHYIAKKKQKFMIAFVLLSIGILFFFKYAYVFFSNYTRFPGNHSEVAQRILIPLGISYYTLQLISYVVDVSRGDIHAEKNPLKVLLFGMFFLSILQGPFNRYHTLMSQIDSGEKPRFDFIRLKFSCQRILLGYIKKLCIADQMAIIVNEIYGNCNLYSGSAILLAIICYAIQLYADFSAYMDIFIGIGEMLCITLPENFNQPFFSKSISEFWQKWHISLGNWLKDYVFFPILKSSTFKVLGKKLTSRYGKKIGRSVPTYLGMLILWTLIGLWHGAEFHFVFSVGLLQFVYIIVGNVGTPLWNCAKSSFHIREESNLLYCLQAVRTTFLMMFAWIFFRAPSFTSGMIMISQIFKKPFLGGIKRLFSSQTSPLLDQNAYIWLFYIIACVVALFLIDLLHERGIKIRAHINKIHIVPRTAIYLVAIIVIIVFGAYGGQYNTSNFIYFDF